jgi:hypothetical protein
MSGDTYHDIILEEMSMWQLLQSPSSMWGNLQNVQTKESGQLSGTSMPKELIIIIQEKTQHGLKK